MFINHHISKRLASERIADLHRQAVAAGAQPSVGAKRIRGKASMQKRRATLAVAGRKDR
jgi:hypothetical protein